MHQSMQLQEYISLRPYNTFGIDVAATSFLEINDISDLEGIEADTKKLIIGGGSNLLLTKPVDALVLHNKLKGITVEKENDTHIWLRVAAGEIWHELVLYVVNKGWGGVENLALIPGTVGAAPIQNIGAYGTEIRETIDSVTFWYWSEKKLLSFSNRECEFGYRDSIFKNQMRDKFFITSVVLKLDKVPKLNTSYGAIEQELAHMGVTEPTVKAVAYAVIHIRTDKLPDPAQIGNAGSFFKNPSLSKSSFDKLLAMYPKIPFYPVNDSWIKVPAAWLIEQCGWKGYRIGDVGVHTKQALVLVNYGHAHGQEIWDLSGKIVQSVHERFGIQLEREVQVW